MMELSSEQSRSMFLYAFRVLLPLLLLFCVLLSAAACVAVLLCCCCSSSSAACFLMLFVTVCQMEKNCGWFIASDLSVLFLFIQTLVIFDVRVPLGSTVAFMGSICQHQRQLRACAESRRASARRGEARLVYLYKKITHPGQQTVSSPVAYQ